MSMKLEDWFVDEKSNKGNNPVQTKRIKRKVNQGKVKLNTLDLIQSVEINSDFINGIRYLKNKKLSKSFVYLSRVISCIDELDPCYRRYKSFLGVVQVLNGDSHGIRHCYEVVKEEKEDVAVFILVALAELKLGHRLRAIKMLDKGLEIDPNHKGLLQTYSKIGQRQKNSLSFLSRDYSVNKVIGRMKRKKSSLKLYDILMEDVLEIILPKKYKKELSVGRYYKKNKNKHS
jgi:tetratricopeptide (TPR) repeat protein